MQVALNQQSTKRTLKRDSLNSKKRSDLFYKEKHYLYPPITTKDMEESHKLSINQWAEADRPREKMMNKGAEALSDAELLGILIGSGNTDESAVELMRRVLATCDNNLNELGKWDVHRFAAFKGMGPAKSLTVMAALELGKRRKLQEQGARAQIIFSKDIYQLFQPQLCDLPHEEFWLLLLNQASKVIDKIRISSGGIDGTYVDVRTVMREALLQRATQIALIHNHPSGNATPSSEDRQLTRRIKEASKVMNIRLADHVIISDEKYYSFADKGEI